VLTCEKFDHTRRNAGEFRLAIKNATLLRRALGEAIGGVRNQSLSGNMNKLLRKAASQDKLNEFGARQTVGDVSFLTGFEFNPDLLLETVLPVKFRQSLAIQSGTVRLQLPSFMVRRKKGFPKEATHFRIVSCGSVVNLLLTAMTTTFKAVNCCP
jgi:hypothetical protein